jgi:hypothetical protein
MSTNDTTLAGLERFSSHDIATLKTVIALKLYTNSLTGKGLGVEDLPPQFGITKKEFHALMAVVIQAFQAYKASHPEKWSVYRTDFSPSTGANVVCLQTYKQSVGKPVKGPSTD